MPQITLEMRLDRLGDEARVRVAPGTAARLDAAIDIGAATSSDVTIYAVVKGPNGDQVVDLSKSFGAGGLAVTFTEAEMAGISELLLRVTTAASTAPTVAHVALSQDVPDFVTTTTVPIGESAAGDALGTGGTGGSGGFTLPG